MTEKTIQEKFDEHLENIKRTDLDDINEILNAILVTLVRILDSQYVGLASRDESGNAAAEALEATHTDGRVISPLIYIKDPE